MSVIGDRIKARREEIGISQVRLAELAGIHPVNVSKWVNDKAKPEQDSLEKLASALQTSKAYLLGETNDPAPPTSDSSTPVNLVSQATADEEVNAVYDPDEVKVPLYRMVSVCAGYGVDNGVCAPEVVRRIPLKRRDLGRSPDDAYIAVEVSGTSMEPRIPDGSTVVVDTSHRKPQRGDVCYVRFRKNGGFEKDAVKFVYPTKDGGLELKSAEGSGFPSEAFTEEDLRSGYIIVLE